MTYMRRNLDKKIPPLLLLPQLAIHSSAASHSVSSAGQLCAQHAKSCMPSLFKCSRLALNTSERAARCCNKLLQSYDLHEGLLCLPDHKSCFTLSPSKGLA